jgi:hypothetical protein
MRQVEDERGLSMSNSDRRHIKMLDFNDNNNLIQKQKQNNRNFLPENAVVTMTNQPNSVPLPIKSGGETLNNFMKRVEDERGLSMSKSGVEHLQIRFPMKTKKTSVPTEKQRSFFSKLFNW